MAEVLAPVGPLQVTFVFSHGAVLSLIARGAHAAVIADVVLAYPVVEAGLGDAWRTTIILFPESFSQDIIFKHFSRFLVLADFLVAFLFQVALEDFFQEIRTSTSPSHQNFVCLRGRKKH